MSRQPMTAPDGLWFGSDHAPDAYELGSPLGSGGEGQVYEATVVVEGRPVRRAVKVYRAPLGEDATVFAQKAEAWWAQLRIVQSLSDTTTARLHEVFPGQVPHGTGETVERMALYMVMEWIDGLDLSTWVANNPDRDFAQSVQLVKQAAAGLTYLHSGLDTGGNPIIHRDVKPSNLMVLANGDLRIVDLGLARGADRAPLLGGSPGYWAPEVRRSGEFSAQSDLYSLAATTYFLFTGTNPTDNPDLAAMKRALAAIPMVHALPRFPDVVLAGMAQHPAARPDSVQAWVAELIGAGPSTAPSNGRLRPPAPPPPVPPPPPWRIPLRWVAAFAVVLAIAGFLVVDGVPSGREPFDRASPGLEADRDSDTLSPAEVEEPTNPTTDDLPPSPAQPSGSTTTGLTESTTIPGTPGVTLADIQRPARQTLSPATVQAWCTPKKGNCIAERFEQRPWPSGGTDMFAVHMKSAPSVALEVPIG